MWPVPIMSERIFFCCYTCTKVLNEYYILIFVNSALLQTEGTELLCNTEKDRDKKLNHHTAGTLT